MKGRTNRPFISLALLAGLGWLLAVPNSSQGQVAGQVWVQRHVGPTNIDIDSITVVPAAMAIDANGNVFVTGSSWNGTNNDYATIAYSEAGVPLWTNSYNGPGNSYDQATAVASDNYGNVYVTGYSTGTNGFYSYATIAYSNAGVPLWTNRYGGPLNFGSQATAIAVDGSNHVFVTGYYTVITPTGDTYDYATIAYSSAGVPLWTNRYNGPANNRDMASAVAVGNTGNIIVTGSSVGSASINDFDYTTIAYSVAGVPLWTNRYNGPEKYYDVALAMTLDSSGNVFVTGATFSLATISDYATVKYSNMGVPLWTNLYNGIGNGKDGVTGIAVDGSGNAFVTGYSAGSGSGSDYLTIAYSGAGVPLWTNRYNGSGNSKDEAHGITVDQSGRVFVTGFSSGNGTTNDYTTIAYSNSGVPLWTNRYNGSGNGRDVSQAIVANSAGEVFVTGYSWNGTKYDLVTIKYSTNVTATVFGSMELQAFLGSNCPVRFVASTVSGGVTNYLQTNDVTLSFTSGVAAYSLPVPTNTTHISAKTAWHLRRRQAVNYTNGVATVNFTSANNLRAGDLALGSPGIGNTDNAVTASDYLLLLGNYLQSVNGDANITRADLNGDGVVSSTDYLLLLGNYLTSGDAP